MENPYIPSVLVNQDLERMKFAQNLKANPGVYSAHVADRVNEISNEVYNRKRSAFQKAHIDLARYMDMDHNANLYKTRSADVDRLSDSLIGHNHRIVQDIARDKDISKRQFEINEWYNYNKLETLFFLQIFFIAALCMAIIVFLQKNGTITNTLAALVTGVLFAIVGGVGVYRYYYTRRIRDPRLWHRRYFGASAKAPPAPAKCSKDGELEFDLNTIIPKSVTQCAEDAVNRFGNWQDNLEKEMMAFQEKGDTPSRISGIGSSLGGLVCENLNQG